MKLYLYKIPCTTCAAEYELWLPEDDEIVCPVNSAHTIDEDEVEILQTRSMGEVRDAYDKQEVIAESKPPGHVSVFTCIGDTATGIADGKDVFWDWSNSDDVISTSVPGMKLKRLKVSFVDPIYIKEGALYFYDVVKGSYARLRIVCPAGQYYLDRNGAPQLASLDVTVHDYVPKHFLAGSCPMGDEMNTESCARDTIPVNYQLWVDIFVPVADVTSYGWVSLEIYRTRTCLFPGESI